MSRWTAFFIAAAACAAFSSQAPAAQGRGGAAPVSIGARPMQPSWAIRAPSGRVGPRAGLHAPRQPAFDHRVGRPPQHAWHGHEGRRGGWRHARRFAGGVWGAGYAGYVGPAFDTGYAEPPLEWIYAEPDVAPCSRPLVIQINGSANNRSTPRVIHGRSYAGGGCGAPQYVRYDVSRQAGAVVRARN